MLVVWSGFACRIALNKSFFGRMCIDVSQQMTHSIPCNTMQSSPNDNATRNWTSKNNYNDNNSHQRNKPLQFSPIQYNVNVVDLLWKFIEYYYITVYT